MQEIKTIKDVEYIISRAIWTDRKLPKVGLKTAQSHLGRIIAPDDTERCLDDIVADLPMRERPTQEDIQDWERVMLNWLPQLDPQSRDIIIKRCSGMGWKRIAYEYHKSISTVKRRFFNGIFIFK